MTDENYFWEMQLVRFEIFKVQDPENFDVTFEVDGKIIYANKYVLETVSPYFKSMLSDRWNSNKNDPIKIKDYSYDDFYRFLTFLYSCDCDLTEENISTMIDMAEIYGVAVFKNFSDAYISSKIEYTTDNIFSIIELITKYSLLKSDSAVDQFVFCYFEDILQSDQFININKSVLQYFFTYERGSGLEESLFEAVYKWAENQYVSDEDPQKCANKIEGIKAKMVEFLPYIKFNKMSPGYFAKFVVPKELFTFQELSAISCEQHKITVTVKDRNEKTLTGCFIDTINAYDAIKAYGNSKAGPWLCNSCPTFPSDLKKNENVQFYFVLADRQLRIKKPTEVTDSDFLLCEMEGDTDFIFKGSCIVNVCRK